MDSVAEGEAQRYFDHAITLRDAIMFLRYNRDLGGKIDQVPAKGLGELSIYAPRPRPRRGSQPPVFIV